MKDKILNTFVRITLPLVLTIGHFSLFAQNEKSKLEEDRVRWNKFLTVDTTRFNLKPNALLVNTAKNLKPGKALDLGMGQGRNSIFLAKEGWDVTGVDIADKAVEAANKKAAQQQVKIKSVIVSMAEYDFGKNQWDLIAHVYEGCFQGDRDIVGKIKNGLKPGGTVVFEFYHREAGIEMKRPDFGCETNVIKQKFEQVGGFTISLYEEKVDIADFSLKPYKLVKLVAIKN